jgi:hypothetical protein
MAALASSRQHPAPVQQLTPPSSSHGGGASWDYAVPLDSTVRIPQPPTLSYVIGSHAFSLSSTILALPQLSIMLHGGANLISEYPSHNHASLQVYT